MARQDGDDTETPGRWSHVWPRHHSCLCNAPIILLGYVELSKKNIYIYIYIYIYIWQCSSLHVCVSIFTILNLSCSHILPIIFSWRLITRIGKHMVMKPVSLEFHCFWFWFFKFIEVHCTLSRVMWTELCQLATHVSRVRERRFRAFLTFIAAWY